MDLATKAEKAERDLDKFIDSRAKRKGEDSANLEAALERQRLARKIAAQREENRVAWCEHYRRLTDCYLRLAFDARRRAREVARMGEG